MAAPFIHTMNPFNLQFPAPQEPYKPADSAIICGKHGEHAAYIRIESFGVKCAPFVHCYCAFCLDEFFRANGLTPMAAAGQEAEWPEDLLI